ISGGSSARADEPSRTNARTRPPSASVCFTTFSPFVPVAPVTSTIMGFDLSHARGGSSLPAASCRVGTMPHAGIGNYQHAELMQRPDESERPVGRSLLIGNVRAQQPRPDGAAEVLGECRMTRGDPLENALDPLGHGQPCPLGGRGGSPIPSPAL